MAKLIEIEKGDVLTDVLSTLALRGRVFCVSELSAPWSIRFDRSSYAHFHVIERGQAWARLEGEEQAFALQGGDLVVFPHGGGHVLADQLEVQPVGIRSLIQEGGQGCNVIRHGGGGNETRMTCGSFELGSPAGNPLLAVLPPLLHVPGQEGQVAEWLSPTLRLLAQEARHPSLGSETLLTRLTDIVFVQAVRAWLTSMPPGQAGWLGALRDPQIGAALGLLHRQPSADWSLEGLAKKVGMSRSPFAARFTKLVGEPPLTYLAKWRLHLAADRLARGQESVKEVAARSGYESEAAFSKAFKKTYGAAPTLWRRQLADPSLAA